MAIHLICNAHLDPVWQWDMEEGIAAAISTFRAAADLAEEFDGFIFNHNEALLYEWIEDYEPALFSRIVKLVKEGKWHIIGGWYLQPDCNMPSGESFVRQILTGRHYFEDKFGVQPTTAINFDPFGHTKGLVQIMTQAGYDSYVVMRPDKAGFELPADDFEWTGFNDSKIMVHRIGDAYNSLLGHVDDKVNAWLDAHPDEEIGFIAWGVGNHGGGPSRKDLNTLAKMIADPLGRPLVHSTPESYFEALTASGRTLPTYTMDLNPKFYGCYTSQILIKQRHRHLENEFYMTEKMLSQAVMKGLLSKYPQEQMTSALKDLMLAQFHDILPGSSVKDVEDKALRIMDHGIETLERLKAKAFFALSAGEEKAAEKTYPILIYNPHPYKVKGVFTSEFMLADQNPSLDFSMPLMYKDGKQIPSQREKERSNLNLDWRKRVVFEGELEPSSMNRFDCKVLMSPEEATDKLEEKDGLISFESDEMSLLINTATGLVDSYQVGGRELLEKGAFRPLILKDNDDSWRADTINAFTDVEGNFTLMTPVEAAAYAGLMGDQLAPVNIIEDGPVRTVVQVLMHYRHSAIVLKYMLPKKGTEFEVEVEVHFNEKGKLLKLEVPTVMKDGGYYGQVAYGAQVLKNNGDECVAQKWTAVRDDDQDMMMTAINDGVYGSDCKDGVLRYSLLRSPAYCALPIGDRTIMVQDRYQPRIDQGVRNYRFWFNGGKVEERLENVDREALLKHEQPYALSCFPSGHGEKKPAAITLDDPTVQMTALKAAEKGCGFIVRLFEPTGSDRQTILTLPLLDMTYEVSLKGFEIKTLMIDTYGKTINEIDLMEGLQ